MAQIPMDSENLALEKLKKEKKKKSKKDKKRKRKDSDLSIDAPETKPETGIEDSKEDRRALRKKEREAKKKAKENLLEQVPKVDEHGISYTKIQIKRMLKRVKRGLPPVPTEEEERERLRSEAQLRREDEAELSGLMYNKEEESNEKEEHPEEDENSDGDEDDKDNDEEQDSGEGAKYKMEEEATKAQPKKKTKRNKAVPEDYVCQACKNKHTPRHWIYDCPDKVTVRNCNKTAKKLRGLHEPDSKKLFVSGLPFDVKPADVSSLFASCGKVVHCKLLKFGDTGRCNGQAYVSLDTDQAAEKALKLSGTVVDNEDSSSKKKKKSKKSADSNKRKELKLKVSRTKSRQTTKSFHK